jgi:hypothetical protein
VLTSGEPLLLSWSDDDPDWLRMLRWRWTSARCCWPTVGSQRVNGVLTTSRKTGKSAFTTAHRDMIELAETRAEQQRLALLDDRDRIAEDLQDDVIRQLFGPSWPCRELPPLLRPVRPARASSTRSATWAAPSPGSGPMCSIYDPCPLVTRRDAHHTYCMASLNTRTHPRRILV